MKRIDFQLAAILVLAAAALLSPALFSPEKIFSGFGEFSAYHLPHHELASSRLQSGQMPFWNPYIFSGQPLSANPQLGLFYPGTLPFRFLPMAFALSLVIFFHIAAAGVGAFLWARARRLDPGGAFLIAAVYAFSPMLIYRIPQGIPTHLFALAFVPWLWLAYESRRRGFFGVVFALQILSGHPQFTAINAGAIALHAACFSPRWLWALAAEGAFAALLAAAQILPTAQFIQESFRTELPEMFANAYSMPWKALGTAVFPAMFGDPIRGDFSGTPSEFFEEFSLYWGLAPLCLALYALVKTEGGRRREALFGWSLAALGIFLALGRFNPIASRLAELPVLGLSRTPARFSFLAFWGILAAAAAGWQAWRSSCKPRRPLLAAVLLFAAADLGFWALRFVGAEDAAKTLGANPEFARVLGGRPLRFASHPEIANPNKAMLYRAGNVNGFDALFLKRYPAYAAFAEGRPAVDPGRAYLTALGSPGMRALGVRYLLGPDSLVGGGIPVAKDVSLREDKGALPLARGERGMAWNYWGAINSRAESWRAIGTAPQGTGEPRFVLAVPFYPGWRAWVDGAPVPIELHAGLLQSVAIPTGRRVRVQFLFEPQGWFFIAAFAAALCCAVGLRASWGLEELLLQGGSPR